MEKDVQNNIRMAIVQKEQEFSDFSNTIDIGLYLKAVIV